MREVMFLGGNYPYVTSDESDAYSVIRRAEEEGKKLIALDITHCSKGEVAVMCVQYGNCWYRDDYKRFVSDLADYFIDTSDEDWWYKN